MDALNTLLLDADDGEGVLNWVVSAIAGLSAEAQCGRLEIKQVCLFVWDTSN